MYEAVDFFASYSEEFDKEGMTKEIAKTQSNKLSEMAKLDVESAIDKFLYDLIRKDKEESEGTEKFSKIVKYIKHDKKDKKAKAMDSFVNDIGNDTELAEQVL